MKRTLLLWFALIAVPVVAQNPLRDTAAEGVESMAWKVTTRHSVCCCSNDHGLTINDDDWKSEGNGEVFLIARLENRQVTKLRIAPTSCPARADRFVSNVTPEASIEFLVEQLRNRVDDHGLIAGLAMHEHPRATTELIALARHHESTRMRRDAIFWLGQQAGEKAAGELRRAVDEDPDDDVRQHAVFAIAQLPRERAVPLLIDLVKNHKRPAIRKKAMFWLAQTGDPRALDLIEEILMR